MFNKRHDQQNNNYQTVTVNMRQNDMSVIAGLLLVLAIVAFIAAVIVALAVVVWQLATTTIAAITTIATALLAVVLAAIPNLAVGGTLVALFVILVRSLPGAVREVQQLRLPAQRQPYLLEAKDACDTVLDLRSVRARIEQ